MAAERFLCGQNHAQGRHALGNTHGRGFSSVETAEGANELEIRAEMRGSAFRVLETDRFAAVAIKG